MLIHHVIACSGGLCDRTALVCLLNAHVLFCVLCADLSAQDTRPANDETQAQVQHAMISFREAVVAGDVHAASAMIDTTDEQFKQVAEPVARMLVALEAVKSAADHAFGAGTGRMSESGLPVPEEIEAAKVVVSGDRAQMHFDPQVGGPPEPMHFVRIGGQWKLDARGFAEDDDEDGERAAKLAMVFAWGIEDAIDEVEAGKVDGADDPVAFATSHAFGLGMSLSEEEFANLPKKLAELQDKRAGARREAALAPKPAMPQTRPVPALPPVHERDTPVEAARVFTQAIERGDADAAIAMMRASTSAEQTLAAAEAERFIAQARLRRAAVARWGREGMRLPLNDAGGAFVDRFQATINGNMARVWWNDDFPTAQNPAGTIRELMFVKTGEVWKYGIILDTERPEAQRAADLRRQAADMRQYAKSVNQTVADIESGRIKSIEQVRH